MIIVMKYYLLVHRRAIDSEVACVKYIGIYESREIVQITIEHLILKPGFCESPNIIEEDSLEVKDSSFSGFYIKSLEMGIDNLDNSIISDYYWD